MTLEIEIKDEKLTRLHSVFFRLGELTDEYCRKYDDDAPYWYNERANVSFLAGAIWRCGGMALEEYSSDKIWAAEDYPGRTDLWFQYDGKEYVAEAKIAWITLAPDRQEIVDEIEGELNKAVGDAQNNPEKADYKIGIVFIVPRAQNSDRQAVANMLAYLMSAIKSQIQYDVLIPIGNWH